MLFPETRDMQRIENIKADSFYKPFLADLKEICTHYQNGDTPAVRLDEMMIVYETGSRKEYEKSYFDRRARMNGLFLRFLLYGEAADRAALENMVWAICDEFTWAVPAHVDIEQDMADIHTQIDLFAAETAQALAEIDYILGDRLSPQIRRRIRYETEGRIFGAMDRRTFNWETMTNNWSAVCAGCVGMTYLYLAPERYPQVEPRLIAAFDQFFSGYGDDGACTEGLAYWSYGFGYFIYFAQLLLEWNGTDLIHQEKIRNIAMFQQHMYMQDDTAVSFSDGHMRQTCEAGLAFFLKRTFPEEIQIPRPACQSKIHLGDGINLIRFAPLVRQFFWTDPALAPAGEPAQDAYYADAQWFIARREGYAFAAKGGHNGEPHNHNDLGGFILTAGGVQCLCDLGAGEYTREYFGDQRYTLLCNSSRGHSVPVINGQAQLPGAERQASVLGRTKDSFTLELAGAYGLSELLSLVREFRLSEDGVQLRDTFQFAQPGCQAVERFVSVIPPAETAEGLQIGAITLICREKPAVSQQMIKNHQAQDLTVYLIDYPAGTDFKITFRLGL